MTQPEATVTAASQTNEDARREFKKKKKDILVSVRAQTTLREADRALFFLF